MPALPPVAKVIRVALIHTFGGDSNVVTRFFVSYSGTAPLASDLNTFCAAVATQWGVNVKALAGTNVQLTSVVAEDLTSPTGAVGAGGTPVTGTLAGATLNAGTAFVVSYVIARRYRGGHPRGYWPFGNSTVLTDAQHWTSGFTGNVTADVAAFFTAVNGAGWAGAGTLAHVNVSYFSGFTVVTNPTTHRARNVPTLRVTPVVDAVTAVVARQAPGSQRRRN